MLAFTEGILNQIRTVSGSKGIIEVLKDLASHLGFRSAFLLEYSDDLSAAVTILDSDAARTGWWDQYMSGNLRPDTKSIEELLSAPGIIYLTPARFVDMRGALPAFARRVDMSSLAVLPIHFSAKLAGTIGLSGETRLSPEQEKALRLVGYALFAQTQAARTAGVHLASAALTPREAEVLALTGEGYTAQEAADSLGLSARTITQHLDHVAEKLGTRNRVHTVAEALRRKLI